MALGSVLAVGAGSFAFPYVYGQEKALNDLTNVLNELGEVSKKFGVDPKLVSSKLGNDLDNINKFLNQSISDIAKTLQSWVFLFKIMLLTVILLLIQV